ncbi:MAG: hypothetical protein V6Z78_04970 [Holosporaceae bacterium]
MVTAAKTKRPRWGAWALAWIGLLAFGAKAPCLLAMNNGMSDLEYAIAWYSTDSQDKYITMMAQADAAYPGGLPNGINNAFDLYAQQIAAGASDINRDIPWAIQTVANLIDDTDADDSFKIDTAGNKVSKNDLYRKIQQQLERLAPEPGNWSLDEIITPVNYMLSGIWKDATPLNTLLLKENKRLGKPAKIKDASFFKRLEYIQGWPYENTVDGVTTTTVKGGLIGSGNKLLDTQTSCRGKVEHITRLINIKMGLPIRDDDTLAKAIVALDKKADCSVFAKQIDARTPLKTIPKAVESVVGDFDSAGGSLNAYGLIGFLSSDGYPVTTKDIYRRLNNALTQLDDALDNKFDGYTKSGTTPTLQTIIEKLSAV